MPKKSQVTIFIIVGLLILIAVSLLIYLRSETVDPVEEEPDIPIDQTQTYVESVLDNSAEASVLEVSRGGGRHTPQNVEFTQFEVDGSTTHVAYALYEEDIYFSRGTFEEELCENVLDELTDEIDLSFLEVQGFNYTIGQKDCSATIGEGSVLFDLNLPINITSDGVAYKVEEYTTGFDVDLYQLIENAESLVDEIESNDEINLSEYDYSCSRTIACYEQDALEEDIIEFRQYEPWKGNPVIRLYIAIDESDDILNNTCTKELSADNSYLSQGNC